jgi:hypothetical protein
MSATFGLLARVIQPAAPPGQYMFALIGSQAIAFADAWRGQRASASILLRRALAIREPVLTQDLFRQLFVNVRRYQFTKGKRSRIVLPLATAGPALGEVVFLHKIPVSCGIGPVGGALQVIKALGRSTVGI